MNAVTSLQQSKRGQKRKWEEAVRDPLVQATFAALNYYSGSSRLHQCSLSKITPCKTYRFPPLENFHVNLGIDIEVEDEGLSNMSWMVSELNLIRREVVKKYLLKQFRFSKNYLIYYRCMTLARAFLLGNSDAAESPIGTNGSFSDFSFLVQRYGLVPYDSMPDTYYTCNCQDLYSVMNSWLKRHLSAIKEGSVDIPNMLVAFSRQLMKFLGPVPRSLQVTIDGTCKEVLPRDYLAEILPEFCLPDLWLLKHWDKKSKLDRQKPNTALLNSKDFAGSLVASLKMGQPAVLIYDFLRCDKIVYKDSNTVELMDSLNFFGISGRLTRKQKVQYRDYDGRRSVVLVGVHFDQRKRPQFWLLEDSLGKSRGINGYIVVPHKWLLAHSCEAVLSVAALPKRFR